jgi:hypothetical protein
MVTIYKWHIQEDTDKNEDQERDLISFAENPEDSEEGGVDAITRNPCGAVQIIWVHPLDWINFLFVHIMM